MDISPIISGAVTSATPSPAAPPSDTSGVEPPATPASDTVTLSPAAQHILAKTGDTTPTPLWKSDAVTSALAALNDTSGKTALTAQISAYKSLATLVDNPDNFDLSKAQNAGAADTAAAFATSAFVQHYQALSAQFDAFVPPADSGPDAATQQRKFDYFNGLSSDDQQILLGTADASQTAAGRAAIYGSTDQFKASQQARIDVARAVEAAIANPAYAAGMNTNRPDTDEMHYDSYTSTLMSVAKQAAAAGDSATVDLLTLARGGNGDAWVAKVKAHFDQYGAAPSQSDAEKAANAAVPLPASTYKAQTASDLKVFFNQLATLADSSGKVSAADLVNTYSAFMSATEKQSHGSVASLAGWAAITNSNGAKAIYAADNAYEKGFIPGGGPEVVRAQSWIKTFDKLSDYDQQIVAAQSKGGMNGGDGTPDGFRATLVNNLASAAESDAYGALVWQQQYGHLTSKSTATILGVKINLNDVLTSTDARKNPFERFSPQIRELLKEAAAKWAAGEKVSIDATKLYAAPPSDAEKALAALKAYAAGTAPKSDDEKALAKLKAAAAAGDTAAVTLLKQAAEAQAKADADKKDADKGATDKDQTKSATASSATDAKPVPAVSQTSTATPASVSLQA